ncbi:DUF3618 domain-containing protein [Roseomonas hellenica]|uniref:DUF3618 domain-containing protein n=1 Tax=Plastoroseomonas hellenica TaxID=2687306 RepID=A0ABS5F0P1_9PROT|nr:DUF3618 domain-containing protein [Plastoroseomonas hellenica]MBR0666112.1 DUF3618 domain-containing protein [Plastoroseomonas hellenica]
MSANTDPQGRTAAEIERDVERSRARVSDTIDELRARMSPGQIMDQVVDYARSSGGAEFLRNLGGSVRDNPLPVLLIGAGIGWLALSGDRGRAAPAPVGRRALPPPPDDAEYLPEYDETGFGERGEFGDPASHDDASPRLGERVGRGAATLRDSAKSAAATAGETISEAAGQATAAMRGVANTTSELAGRASRTGGAAAQQARMRYHDARDAVAGAAERAKSGWATMVEERPLLLGALGLAAGAAIGALLPRSEAEDRLMGEVSDAALGEVKEAAEEGYERLRDTLGEQAAEVKDAVADAYLDARDRLDRDGIGAAGEAAADAASQVAAAATDAVQTVSDETRAALDDEEAARQRNANRPAEKSPG